MKVFLGGTCNNSKWRDDLISTLRIDYFNPIVDDWNAAAQQREVEEKENSEYLLYVITPKMKGVYSIAEVIDDSNKNPDKTIFCILNKDDKSEFDEDQLKSLNAIGKMVEENGATWVKDFDELGTVLNSKAGITERIKFSSYINKE